MWRKFLPEGHDCLSPHYGMWLTCFKITKALNKPICETDLRFRMLVVGLLVSHQHDNFIPDAVDSIDSVWTTLLTAIQINEKNILKSIKHVTDKQLQANASHKIILKICCDYRKVTCHIGNGRNYFAIPL